MNSNSFLEREPVGKLMIRYSVPLIVSLLVAALYNIVDQIFIANADYLGSNGNAANNVVFPLTVIALAFTLMIGDGVCAFVSMSLGARDYRRAGDSVGSAALLSATVGVFIAAVYWVFREELVAFFGGRVNNETFRLAVEYFSWIIPGVPFYVFGQAMNPVISADGSPNYVMFSTLMGAGINIVFDPIFIFGFHWGMTGAAVATIMGQIFTAFMSLRYISKKMKAVKFSRDNLHYSPSLMKRYLPLGMCSFLSQISLVISVASVNMMIRKYGALDPVFGQPEYSQIPMAVIGIVMKFFQIVISVVVGLSASCTPITGFNMGAGRPDRVKSLFSLLLTCETVIGVIAFVIVECFPANIASLFGASGESVYYADFTVRCFRTYLCLIVLACVNKAAFIFIQAMGRPWISAGLSMVREVIFGAGLTIIMPIFMGLDGVLWSMPASDALTFIVSACVIVIIYRQLSVPIVKDTATEETSPVTMPENRTLPVIVIGRSFGARGRSVGRAIAGKLGIPYYDRAIISETARSGGVSAKYLEYVDELPVLQASRGSDLSLRREAMELQNDTILTLARKGACVFVGRRADKIVKGADLKVLSVFVNSSLQKRVERVAGRDGISPDEAERRILKADRERAEYYNSLSDTKWGMSDSYDLCVDTGTLGVDGAVNVIECAVKSCLMQQR